MDCHVVTNEHDFKKVEEIEILLARSSMIDSSASSSSEQNENEIPNYSCLQGLHPNVFSVL